MREIKKYIFLPAYLIVNVTLIGTDNHNDWVMMQLKKITQDLEQSGRPFLIQRLIDGLTFKIDYPHCGMPLELMQKLSRYNIIDNKGGFASSDIRQRIGAIMHNQQLYEKLIQSEEQ